MNSYFASVEQQANPFLRGRPVGVCAYLSPGGCIIASSREAKEKGIRTGCRVSEAQAIDPQIVLLENEPAKYRSTTEKIFKLFKEYTDRVEPYSIDEAFLDVSGWIKDFPEAQRLARQIQCRIKTEIGEWLGSSVGVSWTKFLAKFAGDTAPKNGLLLIDSREKLIQTLEDRSLTDLWGINKRLEARLNMIGIKSPLDLKNYSQYRIKSLLGRWGYYLWANLNGLEISSVSQGAPLSKSIGHSYCLPKKTTDKNYLREVLYKLCEKTGRRLRSSGREAGSFAIHLGYSCGGGIGCSFRAKEPLFTTPEIFASANSFLEKTKLSLPVGKLAVSVHALRPLSQQLLLFEDRAGLKNLSLALDKLNDKYGEYTVISGQMLNTEKAAPDRIGFRKNI